MSNYTFGNYICELREKKGLTQSQLGERLGVTNKAVSKWENGGAYPSAELMYPLAKELGVSIEELYSVVSSEKKERSKMRRAVDALAGRSSVIILCAAVPVIVMWVLSWFFMEDPQKVVLLTVSPLAGLMVYGMFRLVFLFSKKNPLMQSWYLDLVTLFFFGLGCFAVINSIVLFVSSFPDGFSATALAGVALVAVVLHFNKKRV